MLFQNLPVEVKLLIILAALFALGTNALNNDEPAPAETIAVGGDDGSL